MYRRSPNSCTKIQVYKLSISLGYFIIMTTELPDVALVYISNWYSFYGKRQHIQLEPCYVEVQGPILSFKVPFVKIGVADLMIPGDKGQIIEVSR